MTSYAIIGASRGIGLEYVRQLAARPNSTVFAVVRNATKSTHLQVVTKGLKNVRILEADVVDYGSLEEVAKKVSDVTGGKLDCLIHNAARMDVDALYKDFQNYANMDELDADFITTYKINALGVIHSISAFLPLLRAGPTKKIVVVSTAGADPAFVRTAGIANMAAYGMTKAAALIATTKWAVKLQDEGFIVVSVSPGLVDTTGTIGENGDSAVQALVFEAADAFTKRGVTVKAETPEESISAQLKLLDGLKPSDNGLFLAHRGGEYTLERISNSG